MANEWQIEYSYGGGMVDGDLDSRNVLGSPLTSVAFVAEHVAGSNVTPAGVFRCTLASTTTLSIAASDPGDSHSPAVFAGTVTVVADGVTSNLNIIPGLSIILSSSSVAGDIFEIGVGCYYDTATSTWVRILPLGLCFTGQIGDERSLYAHNVSAYTQANSQLVVTNAMRVTNGQTVQRPFKAFWQTGLENPTAHTDLLGVPVTFTDLVAGTPNTVSILVNGTTIDVYDVTNDALLSGGVGLECDGSTVYRFDDSTAYCSGEFVLASTLAVTDTATLYVSDGAEFVEIATTDSAFAAGTSPIYLTEASAPSGAVSAGTSIHWKIRLVPPEAKDSTLNQRLFSIRIESDGV